MDLPRIFRKAFLGFYLTYTVGACVWVTITIVAALLRERPVRLKRPAIDVNQPAQVLRCERDLTALLGDLHRRVFAVQTAVLEQEAATTDVWDRFLRSQTDLHAKWNQFIDRWRYRWTEVGQRCRLGDYGGSEEHPDLELLAEAHEGLDELAVSYSALLERFENRYLDRLHEIRQDLAGARSIARSRKDKRTIQ